MNFWKTSFGGKVTSRLQPNWEQRRVQTSIESAGPTNPRKAGGPDIPGGTGRNRNVALRVHCKSTPPHLRRLHPFFCLFLRKLSGPQHNSSMSWHWEGESPSPHHPQQSQQSTRLLPSFQHLILKYAQTRNNHQYSKKAPRMKRRPK